MDDFRVVPVFVSVEFFTGFFAVETLDGEGGSKLMGVGGKEVYFDIFVHGPHHRHPRIAHNQLKSKMREYKETTQEEFPIFATYRRAAVAMLPFVFRNPGVGMNAGAESPDEEKQTHVEDFVQDVSTEVLAETDHETGARLAS